MGERLAHWRASQQREYLRDQAVPVVGTDVSQLLVRSPRPDHYLDEGQEALHSRIRAYVRERHIDVGRLIPLAKMYRAMGGGGLRTMSGGLAHENGWMPLRKGRRQLHWQGVAQRALLVRCESDFRIEHVASESVALAFPFDDHVVHLTFDVETKAVDGTITVWEVKRDERDLADPDYRHALAMAAEIFRRCGIRFGVIFRDEIFESRTHRANAELFAGRAFVTVSRMHIDRLEAHAMSHGAQSTYGALAEALEPSARNFGKAVFQALVVRRRVEIDLTRRIRSDTPVIIH